MISCTAEYKGNSRVDKKSEVKPYDFTSDYKKLPVKNRAGLIRAAKDLLKQQDKGRNEAADVSPLRNEGLEEDADLCGAMPCNR